MLNAPRGLDRLEHATNNASFVVAQLPRFQLSGHHAYMVAATIHVTILQERKRRFGRGELLNIRETLLRAISEAEKRHVDWIEWHKHRYRIKSGSERIYDPDSPVDRIEWYWVVRDGKALKNSVSEDRDKVERFLAREIEHEWTTEIHPRHVKPSEEIVARWRELLASLES